MPAAGNCFFQNKNQCNRTRKCNENRLIQTAFRYVRYRRTAAAYTKNGQQILYFVSGIAAAFGNHISKYRICDTPDDAKRFNLRKQKITDMVYRHSDHADDFERGCAYTAHCSIVATFCLYHSFSPPHRLRNAVYIWRHCRMYILPQNPSCRQGGGKKRAICPRQSAYPPFPVGAF